MVSVNNIRTHGTVGPRIIITRQGKDVCDGGPLSGPKGSTEQQTELFYSVNGGEVDTLIGEEEEIKQIHYLRNNSCVYRIASAIHICLLRVTGFCTIRESTRPSNENWVEQRWRKLDNYPGFVELNLGWCNAYNERCFSIHPNYYSPLGFGRWVRGFTSHRTRQELTEDWGAKGHQVWLISFQSKLPKVFAQNPRISARRI